jgi:hypothetical protein
LRYWPLRVGYQSLIINCLKPLAAGQDVAIFCKQTQAKFGDIFIGGYKALPTNRFYTFGQVWEALMIIDYSFLHNSKRCQVRQLKLTAIPSHNLPVGTHNKTVSVDKLLIGNAS